MPRLRFTRAEAESEAIRLATEFVAALPRSAPGRCIGAYPDRIAPKGRGSKHPVNWDVGFVFHPPGVAYLGGEVFVMVDLETQAVATRE